MLAGTSLYDWSGEEEMAPGADLGSFLAKVFSSFRLALLSRFSCFFRSALALLYACVDGARERFCFSVSDIFMDDNTRNGHVQRHTKVASWSLQFASEGKTAVSEVLQSDRTYQRH